MFEFHKLYLTRTKKYIELEIYIPKSKNKLSQMYFLDGQNTFFNKHATYGRALKAQKYLKKYNTLGIAIKGANNDLERIKEYGCYPLKEYDNLVNYSYDFILDLNDTIIPYIENKYNVIKDRSNRIIYGSSLAALTSLYIGLNYDTFKYVLAFSTASFLCENELFKNISISKNKPNVFIYVGFKEKSDNKYESKQYLDTANNLYNTLINNHYNSVISYDKKGIHNEKYWSKHLKDFFKYRKRNED